MSSSHHIWRNKFIAANNDGLSLKREGMNQGLHAPSSCKMDVDSHSTQKEIFVDVPISVPGLSVSLPSGVRSSDLLFNRLQPHTEDPESRRWGTYEFKQFMVREAVHDEELWIAAWLRAESHWEGRECDRYADNHKRKFAEQEFNALKRRCKWPYGPQCTCIVAVWKDHDDVKQLVVNNVVATLDLSIHCLKQGETFPGERVIPLFFCPIDGTGHRSYGYIANLGVAKSVRRQGIATNMMKFTLELARASGVEQVFAHVHRHNWSARELYTKLGFEIVAEATDQLAEEQQYLLCLDI